MVTKQHNNRCRLSAVAAATALVVAACGGGSDATPATNAESVEDAPSTEAAATDTRPDDSDGAEPAETEPTPSEPAESAAPDTAAPVADDPPAEEGFQALGPATGEPMLVGMVNTEGTPGLDFPEMRTDTDLAVAYLNEHGGMGGRPVELVHCAAAGSPETSQACAQELSGRGVEFVMLGLDLFPGYDTFAASSIPVFGALPILPGDYTSSALFVSGGNATTMAAMTALAVENFGASTVGIISADNAGANGSEAALIAALDKAGLTYVSVKGGDNETDAGFQGLIREANKDNPDVLVSLYADAGCIGAMRGRASLGITTPVITTPICGSAEVIDVVGDDAVGWFFVAAGGQVDSPTTRAFNAIIEPVYGDAATVSLGLGALGITQVMTLARVANQIAAAGGEVTGAAIFETLSSTSDIRDFPNDSPLSCGLADAYPTICSFVFPAGEYIAGGEIQTVPGFEAFSVVDYLP